MVRNGTLAEITAFGNTDDHGPETGLLYIVGVVDQSASGRRRGSDVLYMSENQSLLDVTAVNQYQSVPSSLPRDLAMPTKYIYGTAEHALIIISRCNVHDTIRSTLGDSVS